MIFLFCLFISTLAGDCSGGQDCFQYCRVTYNGKKNFYNETDGNCYSVVNCPGGQFYEYQSNSCISPEKVPDSNYSSGFNSSGNYFTDKNIVCVHGKMTAGICLCDEGYYTSINQNPSLDTVNMCDTTKKPENYYSQGKNGEVYLNNGGDSQTVDVALDPVYKVAVLLGSFLFSCCLSCLCVRKLNKKLNY